MARNSRVAAFYPANVLSSDLDSLIAYRQVVDVVSQKCFEVRVFTYLSEVFRHVVAHGAQTADSPNRQKFILPDEQAQ